MTTSERVSRNTLAIPQTRVNKTIVFLGNSQVGKTSILIRFTKKNYKDEYIETLGVNYYAKENETEYGKVQYHLWDSSGSEIEDGVLPANTYKNADAFTITISYDDKSSFSSIGDWITYIQGYKKHRNSSPSSNHLVPSFIVINKCDIRPEEREFTKAMVEEEVDEYNLNISIVEVSAKDNWRIDFMFLCITVAVFGSYSNQELLSRSDINLTFDTLVNPKKKRFRIVKNENNPKKGNKGEGKNNNNKKSKDKEKCCE